MTKRNTEERPGDAIAKALIAELAHGETPPWIQPWYGRVGMPTSLASGKQYSGINILALWSATRVHRFGSAYWTTFANALSVGGHVRRGQRGTKILALSVPKEGSDDADAEPRRWRRTFTRSLTVFNVEQCEGVPLPDSRPSLPQGTAACAPRHMDRQDERGHRPPRDARLLRAEGGQDRDAAAGALWRHGELLRDGAA